MQSRPLARGGAEPLSQAASSEQAQERGAQGAGASRGDEQARDAVLDGIGQPADGRRDDGSAVRHRLARNHAVALAARRADDDRGALVERPELWGATKPRAPGTRSRSGPSPTTTRGRPSAASTSSRTPFSSASRPT